MNTQETWELECDEQVGSHTKLPNLFHDMIVSKANIIYENVFSVNVTKGERRVRELPPLRPTDLSRTSLPLVLRGQGSREEGSDRRLSFAH